MPGIVHLSYSYSVLWVIISEHFSLNITQYFNQLAKMDQEITKSSDGNKNYVIGQKTFPKTFKLLFRKTFKEGLILQSPNFFLLHFEVYFC